MKQILLGLAVLLMPLTAQAQNVGHFVGRLVLSDDRIDDCTVLSEEGLFSIFRLVEDFSFVDPEESDWVVPSGACVNGASIPPAFWSFIGGPWTGKYRRASVIHDYFTQTRERSWQTTHRVFYYGLLASDVPPSRAKLMYYAVRRFGARWEEQTRSLPRCVRGSAQNCEEWDGGAPPAEMVTIPDGPEGDISDLVAGMDFEALSLEDIDRIADQQMDEHASRQ